MDKNKLPLGYGGTYLHADTILLAFICTLRLRGSSIDDINTRLTKLLGRIIDIGKFKNGDEFRQVLSETQTKVW